MQAVHSRHPPGGVCMITGEHLRYAPAAQCLTLLRVPGPCALAWPTGVLVATNINLAFKSIMDNPALEWAWLMGDDHTFGPTILMDLLDREVDVVLPLCLNRAPPIEPTIIEPVEGGKRLKPLSSMPTEGLYKLKPGEVCGDAGMLVRRHVLEEIGEPWHRDLKSGAHDAEDREFIQRIMDHGFDVHVDVEHPIGHIAPTELIPVQVKGEWQVRVNIGGKPVVNFTSKT